MSDEQIERFLKQWCNAVERFQTPNLSAQALQANAQKEIDGITASIRNNSGVKRLATNPLLLRTLALIHRTGARLPQRRIELYKLAADTLIKDWELARGIPEAALVNDEEATRLLSELGIWMHENKPAALATEGEVKNKLAEVKAELAGKQPDDPEILKAVSEFLEKIRHHTGLFVERAPKRYGFMHLTFEEYFAARWMVNKPRQAARRIRTRLHRPRWEEPILLAVAFYGMNFDDVSDLVEEAILGKDLGGPSPYEDVLQRDLFFVMRLLGDQDVRPSLQHQLVSQFAELWLNAKESGEFKPLRNQWKQTLRIIANSKAGKESVLLLIPALKDENEAVRSSAASALGNATQFPEVVPALLTALKDENEAVRTCAASALGNATLSAEVVPALLTALKDKMKLCVSLPLVPSAMPLNSPKLCLPYSPHSKMKMKLCVAVPLVPSAMPLNSPKLCLPCSPHSKMKMKMCVTMPLLPSAMPLNSPKLCLPCSPHSKMKMKMCVAVPLLPSARPLSQPKLCLPCSPHSKMKMKLCVGVPLVPSARPLSQPKLCLPCSPHSKMKMKLCVGVPLVPSAMPLNSPKLCLPCSPHSKMKMKLCVPVPLMHSGALRKILDSSPQ